MKKLIKKLRIFRLKLSVWKQKSPYIKIPFIKKIWANIRGFKADHYALYNLKENNYKEYLTEIDRWRTREVNGNYNILLDDKLAFYDLFKEHINIPKTFAWIKDKNIYDLNGSTLSDYDFFNMLKKQKKLIFKPNYGGGGKGIFTLECNHDGKIFLNGSSSSTDEIISKLNKLDNYIVSEYIYISINTQKIFLVKQLIV